MGTQYNNNKNGIEKINFFTSILFQMKIMIIGWIDNLGNIIEYKNGKIFKSWKVNEQNNIRETISSI